MITYFFDAELQRLLLLMGSLVLSHGENCALKKSLPSLRWIRTGDEVIIDKNNDLFVVDRLKVDNPLFVSRFVFYPGLCV